MERVGIRIKVKPGMVEEYVELHDKIPTEWADLLAELRAAGMSNYSLWFDPETGVEFGYVEVADSWDATCAYLADEDQCPAHARWQALMQNYLDSPIDADQGGQPVVTLRRTFLME